MMLLEVLDQIQSFTFVLADPDLHATVLHLLGIDHTRLTFRHNGIDRRLTDVHGHLMRELVA